MTLGTRALVAIRTRPQLSGTGLGFLFWTTFLIALEPDAISRSLNDGSILTLGGETARIIGCRPVGSRRVPGDGAPRRALSDRGGTSGTPRGAAFRWSSGSSAGACNNRAWPRVDLPRWSALHAGFARARRGLELAAADLLRGGLRRLAACAAERGDTTVPQRQASMRDDDHTIDLPAAIPQEFCVREGGRLTRVAVADVLLV